MTGIENTKMLGKSLLLLNIYIMDSISLFRFFFQNIVSLIYNMLFCKSLSHKWSKVFTRVVYGVVSLVKILRGTQVHLKKKMHASRKHGGCWTCTTITNWRFLFEIWKCTLHFHYAQETRKITLRFELQE